MNTETYAVQIKTFTQGWATLATFGGRSTAYRYAANRRKAWPMTPTRVIQLTYGE